MVQLWQLETLLLQRDTYMNYSRPLSQASVGWSQNMGTLRAKNVVRRVSGTIKRLLLENWQRGWILVLWVTVMSVLFTWKFLQYRRKAAFQIMGYCLATAKGAAETLKLNMALILLPVCRNILTWLRSTRARLFIPFDDNINFHKVKGVFQRTISFIRHITLFSYWIPDLGSLQMIAGAIGIGILLHAGNHLVCDFPRLINSTPEMFSHIASDFNHIKPTYVSLLSGVEGITGIAMVILMIIAFTLATRHFRRNVVKLPSPFNRLTGFNAFWYSHHLLGVVYILLLIHGTFLFLVHRWYHKTVRTLKFNY